MAALTNALEQTLAVFEPAGDPLSTGEVADQLPIGRRSTYDRLDRLVDAGLLRTKAVGSSGRIWWRPADDPASVEGETAETGSGDGSRSDDWQRPDSSVAASTARATNRSGEDETRAPSVESAFDAVQTGIACIEHRGIDANTTDGRGERDDVRPGPDDERTRPDDERTGPDDEDARRDDTEPKEKHRAIVLAYANDAFRNHLGLPADADVADLADVTLLDQDREPLSTDAHGVPTIFSPTSGQHPQRIVVETPTEDRWLAIDATATRDGAIVVETRDATRRVDWETELITAYAAAEHELSNVRDRAVDGYASVNDRGVVVDLDDRFAALVDATADDVLGRPVEVAFDAIPAIPDVVERTLDGDVESATTDARQVGDEYVRVEAIRTEDGVVVYHRDVTERVEREGELKRYASLVDALGEPVYELDDRGCFTFVNDAAVRESGYSREELLGTHVSIGMDDDAIAAVSGQLASLLDDDSPDRLRVEFDVTPKDGDPYPVENRLALLRDEDGTVTGSAGILRDVSERVARKRGLETYERIVETVEEGIYVLDGDDRFTLVNEAYASLVGESVDNIVGEHPRNVTSESAYRTATEKRAELEESDASSIRFHEGMETVNGESFVAEVQFSLIDLGDGAQGRVGVVRDVTERVNRERRIENQRARLEALNEVNAVVRDVATAAVEGSTREDIEALVCEELAAAQSYAFAWIGEVDRHDGTIRLRAEAGVENCLDGVTITTDPDDPRSACPVGRAVQERSVQTVQDETRDPGVGPWCELVARHDFQSAASIPITYEGSLYGVLSVHANRTNAFTGEERAVIERIGEVVGHAFAAVERKRALTSEQVVELDYRIPDAFSSLGVDAPRTGRITFDESVPVVDDELLVFGSVTADAIEGLRALVDAIPDWDDVSIIGSASDEAESRFELHVGEPAAFGPLTSLGGSVDEVTIEDGNGQLMVHVPPEVDVREITAILRETLPGVELVAVRQFSRSRTSMDAVHRKVGAALTERQLSALTAAYHAGFFEWPRDVTGEELSATLGVAPSTFSQHIRKAERKVLAAVFESGSGLHEPGEAAP